MLTSDEYQRYYRDMATATLTDFLRTPKAVIAQTHGGAVRITRRDDVDLVVLKADDLDRIREGVDLAARLVHAALRQGSVAEGLRATFAWTELLSEGEFGEFAGDIERLLWAAAELHHYEALLRSFHGWRETAEAYADGMPRGTGSDLTWLDVHEDVEEP